MSFFKEGNYVFPKWPHDPGGRRFKEALARAGLPTGMKLLEIIDSAKTDEEKKALRLRMPLKTAAAVYTKKKMGREAFLA